MRDLALHCSSIGGVYESKALTLRVVQGEVDKDLTIGSRHSSALEHRSKQI